MNNFKTNEEIVIWGCGQRGKEFIEKYGDSVEIKYCIDSKVDLINQNENYFLGYHVFNPQILDDRHDKIVITVDKWKIIAEELISRGYKMFEDFFPYTYFIKDNKIPALDMGFLEFINSDLEKERIINNFADGRLICVTYGLCHMRIYKKILLDNEEFTNKYMLLDLPPINGFDDKNYTSLKEEIVWRSCDILLCGILSKSLTIQGDFPSVSELQRLVKNKCRIINISGAAFKGFFPQHAENRTLKEDANGISIKKYFAWGDKNINKLYLSGKNVEEIKEIILSNDFYDRDKCIRFFQNELALLQKIEINCDVKIADYIEKIAQKQITHYSFTHPVPEVMLELAKRLLLVFGIDANLEKYKSENFLKMDANEEIIYPSVLKALGLYNKQNIERQVKPGHILFSGKKLSSEEYIKKYIEYVCKS